jgi:hypothetical protein
MIFVLKIDDNHALLSLFSFYLGYEESKESANRYSAAQISRKRHERLEITRQVL